MFDFPDYVQGCQKNLELIKNEVNAVRILWSHIKKCDTQFHEYKKIQWSKVDPNIMEDEIKKFRKFLLEMKGIDKKTNAFLGISEDLKNWATFIPLLAELKDPSMNTPDGRHWKDVKSIVK